MKCPYRHTTVKLEWKQPTNIDGNIIFVAHYNQKTEYPDCYEEACPFYRDDGTRTEAYCLRVDNKVGGDI